MKEKKKVKDGSMDRREDSTKDRTKDRRKNKRFKRQKTGRCRKIQQEDKRVKVSRKIIYKREAEGRQKNTGYKRQEKNNF